MSFFRRNGNGGTQSTGSTHNGNRRRAFGDMPTATDIEENRANRNGAYLFAMLVFTAVFLILGTTLFASGLEPLVIVVVSLITAAICASTLRVAMSWERVVIVRLGSINRVAGPGLYCVIPFVESASMSVDQRIITTSSPPKKLSLPT